MIKIKKSSTADTRTSDFKNVTKEQLISSSKQHINDVKKGFKFLKEIMDNISEEHDFDKLENIDSFYNDFLTGFESHEWWDNHRKINRHHLSKEDGVPEDVDLLDVLEYVVDCVMAGMARSGSVYDLEIPNTVLQKAFQNTVELLKENVEVEKE